MPYLIYALDHSGMEQKREAVRQAHRDFLQSYGSKILASGALLDEDGKTVIGGISLLDTESYAEALQFAEKDPYTQEGIREHMQIHKWRKRWWNGRFLGNASLKE